MKKVAFIIATLLSGSTVVTAAPAPVSDASSLSFEDRLKSLERMMQSRNKAQIKVLQQLDGLQSEVNEVRGVTELHSHKLEQLLERQRDLYQEIEKRVSSPTTYTPEVPVSNSTDSTSIGYSGSLTENEAYDRAVNLVLKERQYDLAIPEFQQFLTSFPDSAYAANAHYWLGQLLFNKSDFNAAKEQFERVVNFYPDSNKRSDALLKLGTLFRKQGDEAKANSFFEKVLTEYPESTAAKLAQQRLGSTN